MSEILKNGSVTPEAVDIARQNYKEARNAIARHSRQSGANEDHYGNKELPGGGFVGESPFHYTTPGLYTEKQVLSDNKGSSVHTHNVGSAVRAKTSHESGNMEAEYEGFTGDRYYGRSPSEVTRSITDPTTGEKVEYKHTFSSAEAGHLITKLALKRIEQSTASPEETKLPKAA